MISGLLGKGFSGVAHLAGLGFAGALGVSSYRDRIRQGQNPLLASGIESGHFALSMLAPLPLYLGLTLGAPVTRLAAGALIAATTRHENSIRMAGTPFSQRFEHSDATARAQATGMQAINAAWGGARMGSEAGMLARRYGRR